MPKGHLPLVYLACLTLVIAACSVGPNYKRPEVWVPSAYKGPPPASFKEAEGWKAAQPNDGAPCGQWWEIFGASQLNALEEQVDVSNQTLAVAETQLRGARTAETALQLMINRYNQRVASQIEVLQARTQLETTRAQAIDLSVQRAQFEHAIATLLGKPPADGVADTMIKAFDRLAKRLSTRRGGRPAPHPSPMEAA